MQTGRCINCHQFFLRRPQNKEQSYCSLKRCQRARKTNWEHEKLASDPVYSADCKDGRVHPLSILPYRLLR